MTGDFLLIAFVFLVAGVVAVPLASKLGLGSVLGYLIAGIAISPILFFLQVDVVSIQHFAEFGVVMMLFLVGLEVEPRLLWQMRTQLLGLGGLQIAGTVLGVAGAAVLMGQAWTVGIAIGCVLAMSSTAIVLQTLNEKGLTKSDGGQASFAILLMQDIAVIPMLALIPLLALSDIGAGPGIVTGAETHAAVETVEAGHGAEVAAAEDHGAAAASAEDHGAEDHGGGGLSLVDGLPGWAAALVTLGAVGVVVLGGVFLTRPIFRYIALAGLRELFTATALMFVIGIALLMTLVGMSPALGTFLAGVVLANSEYRHELESDIDPFRGLLLGLFFMTVGASIDFGLLGQNLALILGLTVGLLALKAGVLLILARIFRVRGSEGWLMALGLAQAGEFGFVLLAFSVSNQAIPGSLADILLLVVALSMLATPGLFILHERVIAPRYETPGTDAEGEEIEADGDIIIAGHGRWGGIVNRMLRQAGYQTTVLDYSAAQLEMLRTFGFRIFYGDATRPDLLAAAGIARARMLVVAIDEKDKATELVRHVATTYPNVYIIARARDRHHVYELYAAGCRDIIRETFDSGVRAGRSAWEALGVHPFDAERMAKDFVQSDRANMIALAEVYDPEIPTHENAPYVARARELLAAQEAQLRGKGRAFSTGTERAWSPPTKKDVEAEERQAG